MFVGAGKLLFCMWFWVPVLLQVLATDAGEYKCSLPTVSGTQTDFTNLIVYGECLSGILSFCQHEHVAASWPIG